MGIVKKDGLKLAVISYIGVILGYVNKIILFPNFLEADEVGLANIIVSIAAIYAQFSALGIPSTTVKFFPFFRDRERKHHGFLSWGMLFVLIGFLLTTILFIIFRPWVVNHYSANSPLLVEYYYYVIPLGFATVFYNYFEAYLRSNLKTVFPSFVNEILVRVLITISISLYAIGVMDFQQFVIFYVLVNCSIALFVLIYMVKSDFFHFSYQLSYRVKKLAPKMAQYGLYSILSNSGNVLIANVDALMIAALLVNGMANAGIYTTVFFISTVILIPYRSMSKITSTIVADYWKSNDMPSMQSLYKKTTLVNTVMGTFIFIALWINIDNIFSFMPPEYATGKWVFLFVSLGRLFDMITGLNGAILITSPKYKSDLVFTILLLLLTFINNYIFIVTMGWGMNGAAFATMITLFFYNIMRVLFLQYNYKLQPFSYNCLWIILVGIIALGINYFIPFVYNPIVDGAIRTSVVGGFFVGIVLLLKMAPDFNDIYFNSKKRFL